MEVDHPSKFDLVSAERKSAAMRVASELLHWHAARGDDLFRGSTELHPACRMGMAEQVSTLLQSGHTRGVWPGSLGEVIPEGLLSPLDENFFICDEKLPIRSVLDIKRDAMSPENWLSHWPTQATTQSAFDILLSDPLGSPPSDMSDI